MTKKIEMGYEEAVARLEELLGEIESPELKMDDMAEKLKEAAGLVAFCEKRLEGYSACFEKMLSEGEMGGEENCVAASDMED